MAMFQKSVINKHLASIDSEKINNAFAKFKENYSLSKIQKINKLKEEEYQDGFLRDIFVDVLGYILNPDENHNLSRELKNQADSKKADGAILKDEKNLNVLIQNYHYSINKIQNKLDKTRDINLHFSVNDNFEAITKKIY